MGVHSPVRSLLYSCLIHLFFFKNNREYVVVWEEWIKEVGEWGQSGFVAGILMLLLRGCDLGEAKRPYRMNKKSPRSQDKYLGLAKKPNADQKKASKSLQF